MPRRILITGVGGFVGAHLARSIAAGGDIALGLDIGPAPAASRSWLEAEWPLDIGRLEPLIETLERAQPDAIVHLAGQSSAGYSFDHPVETFQANAAGTWNLLEAVRRVAPRARVLVVGTADVYGPQPEGSRVGEDAPFRPVSPYALSKAMADVAGEYGARQLGLDVVRTRSFSHIGPGQSDRFVIPSIARQIAEIEAGRQPAVVRVGNLDVTRDLSDVRDIAAGYLALLDRGATGAAYNVCRGEGVALRGLLDALIGRARMPIEVAIEPARMRPGDIPYLVGDPQAIARDTGWRATRPVEQTLDEILGEWRAKARSGT